MNNKMTSNYTKSLSVYFGGELNPGQLKQIINNDVGINPICLVVNAIVDTVNMTFNTSLTVGEETVLDSIVSSYTFISPESSINYIESLGVSSTTATPPIYNTKLIMTTGYLQPGNFRFGWSFSCQLNSRTQKMECRIILDKTTTNTVLESITEEPKDILNVLPLSGFKQLTLSEGNHTIQVDYASSGSSTVSISQCCLELIRIN